MSQEIKDALLKLDTKTDGNWTNDGLPIVASLGITGLTRAEITAVAPQFTRTNPTLDLPDAIIKDAAEAEKQKEADDAAEAEKQKEADDAAEAEKQKEADDAAEADEGLLPKITAPVAEEATSDEKAQLTIEKNKAIELVQAAQEKLNAAQKALDAAVAHHDEIEGFIEAKKIGRTSQHDIMDFINSQKNQRAEKVRQRQQLIDAGLGGVSVSELDASLSAKNKRPNFNVPT